MDDSEEENLRESKLLHIKSANYELNGGTTIA